MPRRYGIRATALAAGLLLGCAPTTKRPPHNRVDPPSAPAALAGEQPSDRDRDGEACRYSAWSAPQPIPGVPAGSIIRNSSLAMRGEHGYVVGNDIYLFDSLPSPPRPLIALTLDGRDIGKPAGDFLFASPRAFVDSDGTLHVLWAEPGNDWRPVVREDWIDLMDHYGSVWHVTYTAAHGWTQPRMVYASSRITWEHGTADMTMDPAAGLYGVVGDDTAETMIHLSFNGGAWQARPISAVTRQPVYMSIAVSSGGRMYVAYVAADRSVRSDANSVFLVRSPDGGRTWLAPQLISRSGTNRATQIRALAAPDGTVHLVWAKNISGNVEPQVIRHVASRDGGDTWSTAEDVDIPDGLGTLEAAVDRCGAVHVTHEGLAPPGDGESEESRLWYARWKGGWSPLGQPFGDLNATEAAMALAGDGSPSLMWSVIRLRENVYESTLVPVMSRLNIHP